MDAITSIKSGAAVGVATGATGAGSWLDVIPDDIGKLAAVVGILLSATLITIHIRRELRESRRHKAELEANKKGGS
jgi:hypothetical protein